MNNIFDDEPDIPAQINIVSTIDVIFAILAFFIISSLFLSRNEGLPVNLPQADSSQVQQQTSIAVTVTRDREIHVNETVITLDKVQTVVRHAMSEAQSPVVVLNADESIPHGQAIAVLDQLRQIENIQLAIATTSTSSDTSPEPYP